VSLAALSIHQTNPKGPTMTSNIPLLNRIYAAKDLPEAKPPFALPKGDWQGALYPARVPPLTRKERNVFQRLFLAIIRRSSGDPYDYNCFLVTARLGRLFPIHTLLVSELLRGGKISPPDTERVIIHVASRLGCQYEYAHHTRMALEHGIGRNEIESLTEDDDPGWSARTRTLLTAADELLETKNLSPTTYQSLRSELDDDQIVEFCMIVGHYVMAAMMLNVAGCEIEGPYALSG
jgi:4-carboxymuconolactone decarboxylase